jgi:pseudouridine synthase
VQRRPQGGSQGAERRDVGTSRTKRRTVENPRTPNPRTSNPRTSNSRPPNSEPNLNTHRAPRTENREHEVRVLVPVRLQKILSQAGIASRRAAERLIAEGRVSINGATVTEMGVKADPADDIRVDGRRVRAAERKRYILLYKPPGFVTTRSDPQRRRTVLDLLVGVREYVYPVGRLDYDTEGLLLLTNDGDLAARLTHPRHGVDRTYEARVAGMPDSRALERLRTGIPLDGHRTLPADAAVLNAGRADKDAVVRLTIREGRNRQVRRMLEAVGHPVQSLKRTRIGPLSDRYLKPGTWRELTPEEVRRLTRTASRGDFSEPDS